MCELVKINFGKNHFSDSTVQARDVHNVLGAKQVFINWFKYHAKHMGLVEDVDYVKVKLDLLKLANQDGKHGGDRKSIDYTIPVEYDNNKKLTKQNSIFTIYCKLFLP